jgi:uncharacterized membrane protein (UPF0127 family)
MVDAQDLGSCGNFSYRGSSPLEGTERKKLPMEDKTEPIHIHSPKYKLSYRLLALLIPSLVFASVLVIYFRFMPKKYAANTADSSIVLGQVADKSVLIGNTEVLVNVADTEIKRRKGLGGVSSLSENHGLLFIFDSQDIRPPFWMKDMLIPIDIIWINDGKISQIDKNIQTPPPGTPDSALELYIPNDTIDSVLEVNAGFSDRHNINVGDSVIIKL